MAVAAPSRLSSSCRNAAPVSDFEAFEVELREMMRSAECEVLACELAKLDVDVPLVEIDGRPAPQVGRYEKAYFTAAGKVRVMSAAYMSSSAPASTRTRSPSPMGQSFST